MSWKKDSDSKAAKIREFEAEAFPLMDQIFGAALKLTKDKLDAEDLTQNTFYKAWKNYDKFQAGSNFRAWLFTILTNNYINDYNRRQRSPFVDDFEVRTKITPADASREVSFTEVLDVVNRFGDVFDDQITEAMNNLPEVYRVTVLLCDLSGLKYEEIAAALGCPIGTVMSRLNRGRRLLAQQLKDYAIENGFLKEEEPE